MSSNPVRRAKNGFKEAFISLIKEEGYSKITVSDIVKRADYNRSSFYKYFTDKEAITEEISDEIIEGFKENCMKTYKISYNENFFGGSPHHSNIIFEYIYNNSTYFDLLVVDDTIPGLDRRLIDTLKFILKDEISIVNNKKVEYNSDFIINFRAYGTYGSLLQWIKSNYLQSPEELAKDLTMLYNTSFSLIRAKSF